MVIFVLLLQESVNYDSQAKSDTPPVFEIKSCFFIYAFLWLLSHYSSRKKIVITEILWPTELKIFSICPFTK